MTTTHHPDSHRARGLAAMRVCGRLADAGIDLETFPDASLDRLIQVETEHVLAGTPSPTTTAASSKPQPTAPQPVPAATPAATAAPGLPPGVLKPPAGSRIHPDGLIRALGGQTFKPCTASGVRLHMAKREPYACPDWVCCKADG